MPLHSGQQQNTRGGKYKVEKSNQHAVVYEQGRLLTIERCCSPVFGYVVFTENSSDPDPPRSIVTSSVSETQSCRSIDRCHHDIIDTTEIFEFLGIECLPSTIYRLVNPKYYLRDRLLKVILPAIQYQKEVLRRAPRLSLFHIRPLLAKDERERAKTG